VPDYLDQELQTAPDAWVDEDGITVSDEEFLAAMQHRNEAMERENVELYLAMIKAEYIMGSSVEMPEHIQTLDSDGDGYLSFDELLKTIDQYFDFQLEISLEELREVNEFFFSQ
jgi:hypothetical protein